MALASMVLMAPAAAFAGTVEREPYGKTADGKDVELFTLTNDSGASVRFISYGGLITDDQRPRPVAPHLRWTRC